MTTKLPFLPDEHHYALANVAARASQLDHHIEFAISVLLKRQPRTAEHLLKNLTSDKVVGALRAILLDTFPEEEPQIENLISEIYRLRRERNDLFHWIWGKSDQADSAFQASARPFRQRRMKHRKASEIQKIADDLLEAAMAVSNWQDVFISRPRGT